MADKCSSSPLLINCSWYDLLIWTNIPGHISWLKNLYFSVQIEYFCIFIYFIFLAKGSLFFIGKFPSSPKLYMFSNQYFFLSNILNAWRADWAYFAENQKPSKHERFFIKNNVAIWEDWALCCTCSFCHCICLEIEHSVCVLIHYRFAF